MSNMMIIILNIIGNFNQDTTIGSTGSTYIGNSLLLTNYNNLKYLDKWTNTLEDIFMISTKNHLVCLTNVQPNYK